MLRNKEGRECSLSHLKERPVNWGQSVMIKEISRAALRHGNLQVKRMLRDRPVMAQYVGPNNIIWKWAAKKFVGEDLSDTIDWDGRAPYHGAKADHLYPCKTERGCIRIKEKLSFEVSWAGAIFELFNISNSLKFGKIIRQAHRGEIKKKEFILKLAEIEFEAIKKAEKFYKKIWGPWMVSKGLPTDPYEWSVGCPSKFEDWIKSFGNGSDYPWKIYSDFYENHLQEWATLS